MVLCPSLGVRREEWKQILRQRVSLASKARAEEQRALEQAKKAYENEEEEEEEEMTDAGTVNTAISVTYSQATLSPS